MISDSVQSHGFFVGVRGVGIRGGLGGATAGSFLSIEGLLQGRPIVM
jgi:hypothetical protein